MLAHIQSSLPTLVEFARVSALFHLHFLVLAGASAIANRRLHLSDELFRKLLHLTVVFSIIPLVLPSSSWVVSVAVCAVFILEAWLGTHAGNFRKSDVAVAERSQGEQQRSMVYIFLTYIFVIAVCWGIFGQQWMAVLSVVAWGVGDAFAALVGKPFGRHKIHSPHLAGTKSWEGTLAFLVTSFAAVFLIYHGHTMLPNAWICALVSFWVALFGCVSELYSRDGMDTIICPISSMTALVILALVAGGI